MFRNKSVDPHNFAMIPRADIPRAKFKRQSVHKTSIDASILYPIFVDEVLPGDTWNLKATMFARLATPITPVMDNLHLETFWFFVPNRILWDNWQKFQGEQINPGDSISYVIPQCVSATGGFGILTIYDYMGLPTAGQIQAPNTVSVNALPLRAYNLIWNEWFRDENLQNSLTVPKNDGPDLVSLYALKRRGKRHDYFTSALPWPQKGAAVTIPLGTTAPVQTTGIAPQFQGGGGNPANSTFSYVSGNTNIVRTAGASGNSTPMIFGNVTGLQVDLTTASAATINTLRTAFQTQKLLERDARGGTRYKEILQQHWGVSPPDSRLQRPEYLGGGSTLVNINPIAQTGPTGTTGASTPLGNLAAIGTAVKQNDGFHQAFTEHGYILGLAMVRADISYQQGLRRMWSRSTRYDFYMPVFAMLGEQAVLMKEIYTLGTAADNNVWGYQERWAEYRYRPSMITGLMRSTTPSTIDFWHYAQKFTTSPTLNDAFITDGSQEVVTRSTAVGSGSLGQQFLMDCFFEENMARLMPMYSVPGLIDHF